MQVTDREKLHAFPQQWRKDAPWRDWQLWRLLWVPALYESDGSLLRKKRRLI